MDVYSDIVDFHKKFNLTYELQPRFLPRQMESFRHHFLKEEVAELEMAETLEKKLDALVDIVYVAVGTAYLMGFDFREAWRRVHAANMKKERVNADNAHRSTRGSEYDIVKPEGWTPPDLSDLV